MNSSSFVKTINDFHKLNPSISLELPKDKMLIPEFALLDDSTIMALLNECANRSYIYIISTDCSGNKMISNPYS